MGTRLLAWAPRQPRPSSSRPVRGDSLLPGSTGTARFWGPWTCRALAAREDQSRPGPSPEEAAVRSGS